MISQINDVVRQMQATLRQQIVNERGWVDQGDVPTFVNSTTFTVPTDQTLVYTVGSRVWITDGTTNCYGAVATVAYASPNTTVTLNLDNPAVGVPTSPTLVYVGALPVNAALKIATSASPLPIVINGGMTIAQRATLVTNAATGTIVADRHKYLKNGTMVHTVNQVPTVPTVAQAGYLLTNSLQFQLTTAQATLGANDTVQYQYRMEGYDFQAIAQQTFTISFWAAFPVAGTYGLALANSVGDRCYVTTFTGSTAFAFYSFTIPPSPAVGTWNYTNGVGLYLTLTLAAGSASQTATLNAWQTGNFATSSAQVNACASITGNNFLITALTVNPGPNAAPFQPTSFCTELARCQRYFWKSFPYGVAPAQNAGTNGALGYQSPLAGAVVYSLNLGLPSPMRIAPTVTFFNPSAANANWRNASRTADSGAGALFITGSDAMLSVMNSQVAADAANQTFAIHVTADAEL